MKSKKPCNHVFANFKIECEGEDDCIVVKCVHCSERKINILHEWEEVDKVFPKVEMTRNNLFSTNDIINSINAAQKEMFNQNIINSEKYFE